MPSFDFPSEPAAAAAIGSAAGRKRSWLDAPAMRAPAGRAPRARPEPRAAHARILPAARPPGAARCCSCLSLALAGCDSAEERAEAHYQRGMALLAAGDADRALIEFRNVFRLDGGHVPARLAYARVQRERGETRDAMGQYLRVADQDRPTSRRSARSSRSRCRCRTSPPPRSMPRRPSSRRRRDPQVRALKATVDFRHPETRAEARGDGPRGVVAEDPGIVAAQMVLIADRLNAGAPKEALPLIDAALARTPGDQGLHLVRLAALEADRRQAGSGAELKRDGRALPRRPRRAPGADPVVPARRRSRRGRGGAARRGRRARPPTRSRR